MTLPGWRDWAFSIKTFVAAVLAMYLAMWIDLPRPYWELGTVYITSQVLAGATRAKALYRVLGTLLGAVVSIALVPNLVNAPELLTLAIALWVSICLYLSLLDRTPRSYLMMLGGYTAALIGFPSVSEPGTIFDTAVARRRRRFGTLSPWPSWQLKRPRRDARLLCFCRYASLDLMLYPGSGSLFSREIPVAVVQQRPSWTWTICTGSYSSLSKRTYGPE